MVVRDRYEWSIKVGLEFDGFKQFLDFDFVRPQFFHQKCFQISNFRIRLDLVEIVGIKRRFRQKAPLFCCAIKNREVCRSYGEAKLRKRYIEATRWTEGCDLDAFWIKDVDFELVLLISGTMDQDRGVCMVNTPTSISVKGSR